MTPGFASAAGTSSIHALAERRLYRWFAHQEPGFDKRRGAEADTWVVEVFDQGCDLAANTVGDSAIELGAR
ncbi:hypothetical protein J1614_006469 [Plenodomus biglobosus]|nr:hypothetical protein J1614_006469 [Plenodomus biglobosus]